MRQPELLGGISRRSNGRIFQTNVSEHAKLRGLVK
jgi:hypothetical protein